MFANGVVSHIFTFTVAVVGDVVVGVGRSCRRSRTYAVVVVVVVAEYSGGGGGSSSSSGSGSSSNSSCSNSNSNNNNNCGGIRGSKAMMLVAVVVVAG